MTVVSVVIPTHNRASLLRRAAASVASQTFDNWECILVDDASSDQTPTVIDDLVMSDRRFRVIRNDSRLGNTLTRSRGCAAARGEFIALLDSDDWWEPTKLERQVAALRETPHAIWSYHSVQLVRRGRRAGLEIADASGNLLLRLATGNFVKHSSVMIRRDAMERLGGYDERLPLASDWDLLLRLVITYGEDAVVALPEVLGHYCIHDANVSGNGLMLSRAERRVVWRSLVRYGLAIRRPLVAIKMIDWQISREMHRFRAAGFHFRARLLAAAWLLIQPLDRQRWPHAMRFFYDDRQFQAEGEPGESIRFLHSQASDPLL